MAAVALRTFAVAFFGRLARGRIHLARPFPHGRGPALRTWYPFIVSLDEFFKFKSAFRTLIGKNGHDQASSLCSCPLYPLRKKIAIVFGKENGVILSGRCFCLLSKAVTSRRRSSEAKDPELRSPLTLSLVAIGFFADEQFVERQTVSAQNDVGSPHHRPAGGASPRRG